MSPRVRDKKRAHDRYYRWLKRNFIKAYKARPCVDCGIEYPHYVMQLDHIDPMKKKYQIHLLHCRSWRIVRNELKGCQVRCANCHAMRSYRLGHHLIRRKGRTESGVQTQVDWITGEQDG